MFKKMLQVSSALGRELAGEEEPIAAPSGLSSPTFSDRDRIEPPPKPVTAKSCTCPLTTRPVNSRTPPALVVSTFVFGVGSGLDELKLAVGVTLLSLLTV